MTQPNQELQRTRGEGAILVYMVCLCVCCPDPNKHFSGREVVRCVQLVAEEHGLLDDDLDNNPINVNDSTDGFK